MKTKMMLIVISSLALFYLVPISVNSKEYFDKYYVVIHESAPFNIVEQWNGVEGYSGVYVDAITEVSKRTGLELEFVNVSHARALAMMKSGQADMMLGPVWNPENAANMEFLDAPLPSEDLVFLMADTSLDISSYEDLMERQIGVLRSARYLDFFDYDARLRKYELSSFEEGARMLELGRLDVMIVPEHQANYIMQQPNNKLKKAAFSAQGSPSYITISRNSNLLDRREMIENVFRELNSEGYFERLLRVYFLP